LVPSILTVKIIPFQATKLGSTVLEFVRGTKWGRRPHGRLFQVFIFGGGLKGRPQNSSGRDVPLVCPSRIRKYPERGHIGFIFYYIIYINIIYLITAIIIIY
jgi:hypothetical protein